MAKYIALEEARNHLRVDFTEDDQYIENLVNLTEELVEVEIGANLEDLEDEDGKIPLGLKHSMLMLISHYYEIREPVLVGVNASKIPLTYEALIAPYKTWTIS